MKASIHTDKAPAAIGPYSQAIRTGNLLFVSGQIPINPETGAIVAQDIQGQTRQCLENLKAILEASGMGMDNVLKTTVLLADMSLFAAMNEVYAGAFQAPFPARAAFAVKELPKGALIEIEAVATI